MSVTLGTGVLGSGSFTATTVEIDHWRIVFDGAQIWLGREDAAGSTPDRIRLRPVLRVRELPVTTKSPDGSQGIAVVLDCGPVLNRLPALEKIDVSRERTIVPVRDMGEDGYWLSLIESALLRVRARGAGLTV